MFIFTHVLEKHYVHASLLRRLSLGSGEDMYRFRDEPKESLRRLHTKSLLAAVFLFISSEDFYS